jgi:hypothetical protein
MEGEREGSRLTTRITIENPREYSKRRYKQTISDSIVKI